MTDFECKICEAIITSDTSHKKLYEHLKNKHTKKELIPHVGWWISN